MPIGALLMSIMVAIELKPKYILDEVNGNKPGFFSTFYKICITVVAPVVMAFVLAGQMISFFTNVDGSNGSTVTLVCYGVSIVILVLGYIYAAVGSKEKTAA